MKKIYSSLLLVIACLCLGVQNVKAEAGFFGDGACSISLYHTGNSDSWYDSNSTGASNVELGRVKDLYLKGFWFKMWEKAEGDITDGTTAYMNYYICKTSELGNTTPTWTTVNVSSKSYEGDWSTGSQNITLENKSLDVNLLSGLTAGDYTLVYYFFAKPYDTDMYLSNGSQNYTVTFTVPTTIGLTFTSDMANKIAEAEKYDKINVTYRYDISTDYKFDLSSVTALHTPTAISSTYGSSSTPYEATDDGPYLLEYNKTGESETKVTDTEYPSSINATLTIHPVTHVEEKAPTTEAAGNKEYWYCEENNVKRYWVGNSGSYTETTLEAVTLAKLLTTASEGNSLGTLAAGKTVERVFTPTESDFYSFTANHENVGINVYDATYSNSASGTKTCTLECTAGTAYTVTCYNQGSEAVDLTLTIATAENPYTKLNEGTNENVTLVYQQNGSYSFNPTHTFIPTGSGDYKFSITNVSDGANFIVASSSSILYAMRNGSYASGGSTGEAVMLDLVKGQTYYLLLASTNEELTSATFTISTTTVKDKAVYKDGTLTFYCDEKDHSADGTTVYKIINYTNSSEEHVAWNGLNEVVTKVVFDATFANATPDDCYGWFEGFSNLTTVKGLEYVNMSNVEDTKFMFDYCSSLTSITLPATCKSIGSGAFRGCTALTTVNLKSVPSVAESAFTGNNGSDALTGISYTLTLDDNSYIYTGTNNLPTSFASASYTRAMSNQWGTIVLPFAAENGEDYDLYELTDVNSSTLTLTKITESLPVGTPALVRRSDAVNSITISATNAAVSKNITTPVTGSSANGLTLTGEFTTTEITNNNGYIIANNAFWNIQTVKGTNKVYCAPFRAYLAGTLTSGSAKLSIGIADEEETAIETLNAITSGEAEYYDLNGRRLNDLQQGVNIVKFNNGVTKKVIIK